MTSFSERMGFVNPPEFMQLDGMTEELSNLLFNFCARVLSESRCGNPNTLQNTLNDLLKKPRGTFQLCCHDFSTPYGYSFMEDWFFKSFDALGWHEKYTVVEAVVTQAVSFDVARSMNRTAIVPPSVQAHATSELNGILERENSGFRMNDDCQLVPIANQQELDEVSEAQHSNVDVVALHMNKAVACFADREKPDYDNSIKEAVSALEALAQKITGEQKGTLGALSKKLELHPSLPEAVSKLYGYTSDGGIRHAKKDGDPEADLDTAKFVIVTASALINFITAKCNHD